MDVSVVVPVMNEQGNVGALYEQLKSALTHLSVQTSELIFVDDGSTDGTFDALHVLHDTSPQVRVIQFRRNFGKSAALSAGFAAARGDIVFTLDGDLQDDPAEIPRFLEKLAEGYDLVSGWKYPRMTPFPRRCPRNCSTPRCAGPRA